MLGQCNAIRSLRRGRVLLYMVISVLFGTALLSICNGFVTFEFQQIYSTLFKKQNMSMSLGMQFKDGIFISEAATKNTTIINNKLIDCLAKDLKNKLENIIPRAKMKILATCKTKLSIERSCDNKTGCLRLGLPTSLTSRLEQVVMPSRLHYADNYKGVFEDMANSVPGYYDIVLLTGASSNHYQESKALLYNLKKFVYPYLKNFTLVYYDLGLTDSQRRDISKVCQCHVKIFPFSRFPKIFSTLKCYAWKPMIVNAHASRGNLVHWLDASIRFTSNFSKLETLYRRARAYGMQAGCIGSPLTRVTLKSMFHFFGDEACSYHPYRDLTAGFMIFNNEPLIRMAVLTPWSACALDEGCMCPHKQVNIKRAFYCPNPYAKVDEYAYGICHRFEQAALAIIIRKIFQEKSSHLLRTDILSYISIRRGDHTLVKV